MIVAITITRNSDWVLEATMRTALRYCDACAVLDHASSDSTPELLQRLASEFPGRIQSIREDDPVWHEMDHRQRVLELAREMGGTVFANVDDDEILTYNLHAQARAALEALQPGEALMAPLPCVWDGLTHYRDDDTEWSRCVTYLGFADCPGMTFKPAADGYQFHNRRPFGNTGRMVPLVANKREGGVLHLQFASRRRLRAKQALYKLTETLCWPGRKTPEQLNAMYDNTTLSLPKAMVAMPEDWLPSEVRSLVRLDDPPWQEAEVRRLWQEHGPEKFTGLDLYGVVGPTPC